MCGIAGVYRPRGPIEDLERAALARMLRSERHRGPDAEGVHEDPSVLLGHRRLSILDLSASANQPLRNETEDLWLTYNGEIYNFVELRRELEALGHRFRSATDAEVIVHGFEAWGIDGLLPRLRGMFAFALWDAREKRLLLVRDRFGIKPLYYACAETALLFASEVRALAQSGLIDVEPSDPSLASFLALGSIPAPETALAGVFSIPAAHYLEIRGDAQSLKRYWKLPVGEGTEGDIGELLRDVARMHLVSDVPLGIFLSGGIDSAALVALTSRFNEKPLTTLSIVFDDPALDERLYARAVAAKYRTDHHEQRIGADEFMEALPDFWDAMDQPTVDGVNAYLVSRAAREAGLTVVLTGLGGDEVFLGYPHFRKIRSLSKWLSWLPRPPLALARYRPKIEYLREPSPANVYLMFRGLFAPREIEELLPGASLTSLEAVQDDYLDAAVGLEFSHYLGNQLLRDTDAMSMAHSIEARVPFLDHLLVEAVLGLPYERKLAKDVNKPALLRSLEEPLPREVWDRPKQGFTLPFRQFLSEHREELMRWTLDGGVFQPSAVRKLWSDFAGGTVHWSRPWSLLAYSAWRERIGQPALVEEPLPAVALSNRR
jgi:asparagine synthase (glutamine-hydrolysing)